MKDTGPTPRCASCTVKKCNNPSSEEEPPVFCPMKNYAKIRKATIERGWSDQSLKMVNIAAEVILEKGKGDRGCTLSRVEELIEYSRFMGYRKLGLAFCVGLSEEANTLADILRYNGFDVVSVCCMAGAATKDELALTEADRLLMKESGGFCNPLMQAEVLNEENTELNIMLGLCIGHDIIFINNSKADVTPLAVKDRVTGHNPLAAIYQARHYYRRRLFPH